MNLSSEVVCSRLPQSVLISLDFLNEDADVDAEVSVEHLIMAIMLASAFAVVAVVVVEEDTTHHIRVIESYMYTTILTIVTGCMYISTVHKLCYWSEEPLMPVFALLKNCFLHFPFISSSFSFFRFPFSLPFELALVERNLSAYFLSIKCLMNKI
jgi:hypothetical protein